MRIEKVNERKKLFVEVVEILAFDGEEAVPYQTDLKQHLQNQLTRCNICVREYHRGRGQLRQDLEAQHDNDLVQAFMDRFDQMNNQRITKGLDSAKSTLLGLDPSQRRISQLSDEATYALFEAMHCVPFLENEDLLSEHFDEPFRLVQTKQKIYIPEYSPALTGLLFSPKEEHSRWALRGWHKFKRFVKGIEFECAVKEQLTAAMRRVQMTSLEKEFLPAFWQGVHTIVEKLDRNVITHHLRAMDMDIFRLALDHSQIESICFQDLIESIRLLLEKAPKEVWDAFGAISPQTVIEQFLNSPNIERAAKQGSVVGGQSLEEFLVWIPAFIKSVQPSSLPPVCRTLLHHFWNRLQENGYHEQSRKTLRSKGFNVYAQVFDACQQATPAGGTATSDLLELLKPHLPALMENIEKLELIDHGLWAESLNIVSQAVASDVMQLATDRQALTMYTAPSPDSSSAATALWKATVRGVKPNDDGLAGALISGTCRILVIEPLPTKLTTAQPKKAVELQFPKWSERLEEKQGYLVELLERMQDFDARSLERLMSVAKTAEGLLGLLFSGDQKVQQASASLLRSLTSESSRRDAISFLIRQFFARSLHAFADVLRTIARAQVFQPSVMVIKLGTDFLQALCNSENGILRSRNLDYDDLAAIEVAWEAIWVVIGSIYRSTEDWSLAGHGRAIMTEFCRDAMDFASQTFDLYSIISGVFNTDGNTDVAQVDTERRLLECPAAILIDVISWLRLRDEYLIDKAVDLTCKLAGRLKEIDMSLSDGVITFLEQICNNTIRNKMSDNQKATLKGALPELATEGPMVTKQQITSTQSVLKSWAGSSASRSTSATKVSKPIGTDTMIDLDSWKSKTAVGQKAYKQTEGLTTPKVVPSSSVTLDKLRATGAISATRTPTAPFAKTSVATSEFLKKRQEAQEAKKKRDQAIINAARKSQAGTLNAGSGLVGIGVEGKDSSGGNRGQGVMVSSDESEADDDDDEETGLDAELFGSSVKTNRKDVVKQDAAGAVGLKREMKILPTKITRQVRSKKDMRARLQPDLTTLHQIILGWDYFHTGGYPPNSNEWQFQKVSDSFRHVQAYRDTFQPLLTLEAWQGFVKSREEDSSKPFEIKISNRMSVDAFVEIGASISQGDLREYSLSEGDIVLFSRSMKPTVDHEAPHCLSRIHSIKRKNKLVEITYRVVPRNPLLPMLTPNSVIYASKVQSIVPLEREYGAIEGLQYYDLCDEIIKARPSPLLEYNNRQLDPLIETYSVNKAQAKAIRSAIDNDAFTLIQGPPGSGKTKTIVAIVGALLNDSVAIPSRTGTSGSDSMVKKLLVCAPSNAAVDELVMRFKAGIKTIKGVEKKINVLRLGRSEAINTAVIDVTLEELVNKKLGATNGGNNARERTMNLMTEHKKISEALNDLRARLDNEKTPSEDRPKLQEEFQQLRKRKNDLGTHIDVAKDAENAAGRAADLERKRVQQQIIEESHVICATLSGAGHELFQSLNVEFETVVVDEAAQCVEMSALIPLKYGCAKCILVGDPKQLPPTVFSKEAAKFQYEQSLFVRMQSNFPQSVHLLDTQYRMHPDISRFPSSTFYDGRLLDGPDMASLRLRPWHESSMLSPYRIFDVQGQHQAAPKGHSLINLAEIEVAIALYQRLTKDYNEFDFKNKIGIITPYKSQLKELKDKFSRRFGQGILENVDFNTTDAFQGRESEIIIFSCVRASPAGNIGFLQDIRRMNVGLTRAKSSLWVLGNSQSLMRGEYWNKLVVDAQERGFYTTGDVMTKLSQPCIRNGSKTVNGKAAVSKTETKESTVMNNGNGTKVEKKTPAPINQPTNDVKIKNEFKSKPQILGSDNDYLSRSTSPMSWTATGPPSRNSTLSDRKDDVKIKDVVTSSLIDKSTVSVNKVSTSRLDQVGQNNDRPTMTHSTPTSTNIGSVKRKAPSSNVFLPKAKKPR